eukprot:2292827-Rhodomonas_salina.2
MALHALAVHALAVHALAVRALALHALALHPAPVALLHALRLSLRHHLPPLTLISASPTATLSRSRRPSWSYALEHPREGAKP